MYSFLGFAFPCSDSALEEVEKGVSGQLSKLEQQLYNLKRQKLDALINGKVFEKEAAKRKQTVPQLMDAEVTSKVTLASEQEIEKFYQYNKLKSKGRSGATWQNPRLSAEPETRRKARRVSQRLVRTPISSTI